MAPEENLRPRRLNETLRNCKISVRDPWPLKSTLDQETSRKNVKKPWPLKETIAFRLKETLRNPQGDQKETLRKTLCALTGH